MVYYLVKIGVTVLLVLVVSELAKRDSILGALFASIPLVSAIAICWLYFETRNVVLVQKLSWNIFWLVLPSLPFFVALPMLLAREVGFLWAMALALALTVALYALLLWFGPRLGLRV